MATIKLLSARQVDTLGEGIHKDGGNLFLRIRGGSRVWVFRYKAAGKPIVIGLGATNARSLAQARELAAKMRTEIADGKDPALLVRIKKDTAGKTFKDCALALIESKRMGWRNAKHAGQWEATLMQYVYPVIGDKLPKEVTLADVKSILLPIWATKTETATRVRQRVEAVLDYAAVHDDDHGRNNPARWRGVLDKVLPLPNKVATVTHFAAAPYADVPGIMAALRQKDVMSAYCLRFIILTAARSGEARGALWADIDLKNAVWVITASRMKAGREHRVPLCTEALEILTKMQSWRMNEAERIFPGARGGLLSDVAINKMLHGIAKDITVHGFRSAFRQWGAEQTSFPGATLELALAHVNKDKVEAAYQRSDLFERRVELMAAWGRYCANASNIVQLATGKAA